MHVTASKNKDMIGNTEKVEIQVNLEPEDDVKKVNGSENYSYKNVAERKCPHCIKFIYEIRRKNVSDEVGA